MFGWLTGWFRRPSPDRVGDDVLCYAPEQRMIYRHYAGTTPDGRKVIVAKDPMALWKRFHPRSQAISINLRVSLSPSKAAPEMHEKLMEDLRHVFEVPKYEDGGLTELELSQLLDHYLSFIAHLKKKANSSRTVSGETSPGTPTSADEGPTTEPSSGTGSTATGPCTDSPTPSPSGPASPTAPSPPDSTSGAQ